MGEGTSGWEASKELNRSDNLEHSSRHPAQAGVHIVLKRNWMPAFAGMTKRTPCDSSCKFLSEITGDRVRPLFTSPSIIRIKERIAEMSDIGTKRYKEYIPSSHYASIEKILPVIRAGFPDAGKDDLFEALQDVDWSFIARFSERQRVLPILYRNLRRSGAVEFLPEPVKNWLHKNYMQIAATNLRIAGRLVDLCGLFEKNGIPVVPYKGPVLAQMLYGDSVLRCYQDIDLLVPRQQLPEVWRLLHEAGYQPREKSFTQDHLLVFADYGNEMDFIDAGGQTPIDLHWKIAKHTRHAFDMDFCEPRLQRIRVDDRIIRRLSAEDTVLAMCLSGGGDMWPHLEGILTLSDTLAATPALKWDTLGDLARRLRCERMLLLGLFLASDIGDVALPPSIRGQIAMDKALPGLAQRVYHGMFQRHRVKRKQIGAFNHFFWQVRLREHPADKVRYVLRRFFIPTKKDWKAWPVDAGNIGLFFMLRPFGYLRETWREIRNTT